MARNSRDDGLNFDAVWINGKPIRASLLRKTWTKAAIEYYKRGCDCKNCNIFPPLDSTCKCQVKYYVMGYIQLGYYPQKEGIMKNEYGQEAQKCLYFENKKCKYINGKCVICKGQYCRILKKEDNQ